MTGTPILDEKLSERHARAPQPPGNDERAVVEEAKGEQAMNDSVDERAAEDSAVQQAAPRSEPAGPAWVTIVAAILAAVALLSLYVLVLFWPESARVGAIAPDSQRVIAFGVDFGQVSRETLYFVVVIAAGALGGSIHSLRSIGWYAGGQRLLRSWTLRYLYLPLIGAMLATILYIIVRAGFLSGSSVETSSPFGFVALAALAGLFTDQGIRKLRQVFETLLTEAQEGPDPKSEPVPESEPGSKNQPAPGSGKG